MQNCKDPNWNIKTAPISISARLEGTSIVIVDARGAILASVDIAPAIRAVLDAQKKRKRS